MIIGLSGSIGSGKSHTQLKAALRYCDRREKQLVLNFRINRSALLKYCRLMNYKWVEKLLLTGGVSEIVNPENVQSLLLPGSIVCLDEAGVFLNSRCFKTTPRQLLSDLAQSRKGIDGGVDIIYCAQFDEQVDKQLRLLTQYWIHCDSMSAYSAKHKQPMLIWKHIYWMKAYDYNAWYSDLRARSSHFKTRFAYAFDYEGGRLTKADKLLFSCYESMQRLDGQRVADRISTYHRCPIVDVEKRLEYYRKQPRKYLISSPSHSPQAKRLGWDDSLTPLAA